jgi:hypothetical protein
MGLQAYRITAILVAAIVAALVAGACGSDDDDEAGTNGAEESGGEQQDGDSAMFVQTADAGTLRPAGEGRYTLRLTGVDPHAVFFTDRPARDSGVIANRELLSLLYTPQAPPPNGALVVNDRGAEGVAPLELSSPDYDPKSATMVYEARELDDLTRPHVAHFADQIDKTPPRSFGRASLFIDNFTGATCAGSVINTTTADSVTIQSFSKGANDSWVTKPRAVGDTINPNDDGMPWRSDGGTFRGCTNEIVLTVEEVQGNALKTLATLTINLHTPWGGNLSSSCKSSSPSIRCDETGSGDNPQWLVRKAQ